MHVADTHSFLWHLQNDQALGSKARSVFGACDKGDGVVVIPSIVLVESIFICEKKKTDMNFQDILEKLKTASNYYIYPLNEDVVLECNKIKMEKPHDRIIVATARLLKVKLITKDKKIKQSKL